MLINLQELVSRAVVVRGDTVIGTIDHIEIEAHSVFVVLDGDDNEPRTSEEIDLGNVKLDVEKTAEIIAILEQRKAS